MKKFLLTLLTTTVIASGANAASIFPLDRATIATNSPFDFKVELDGTYKQEDIKITINGQDYTATLGNKVDYIASEKDKDNKNLGSAIILRHVVLKNAGNYNVSVVAGDETKNVNWTVFAPAKQAKAKNVIFLVADGLSVAHRTSARIMSKGMHEGKANGRLNMDELDRMAFIGTSATDSIATDSANTMSAYMTGHKTAINAIGVYADRTPSSLDDPRVENIIEAIHRTSNKSVGIVTTSELEDATPAAVVSHTRNRYDKAEIADMMFKAQPEVVLGGGSAYFLPKSIVGSKRKDETNYIQKFSDAGYTIATNATELTKAHNSDNDKIFGLFHTGNLDVWLDREQLKKGTVSKFPNQPGLVQMTKVALDKLSKDEDGFFLMVEAASVDKQSHPMDWERAILETIEFDQAIGVAMEFAKNNPDTLIVVTGDHTHGVSLIGTIDDTKPGNDMREKFGVGKDAGFPNYEDKNNDGFPDRVDVSKHLAIFANNYPDHYRTWRPALDNPYIPAIKNEKNQYIANEKYKDIPGAVFVEGNLPRKESDATHSVDDVVLQSTGPASEGFKGYMEESDVYKVLADALGLGGNK